MNDFRITLEGGKNSVKSYMPMRMWHSEMGRPFLVSEKQAKEEDVLCQDGLVLSYENRQVYK